MSSGHSIARLYRDPGPRPAATAGPATFRQLWLVGLLVLVSLLWSTWSVWQPL